MNYKIAFWHICANPIHDSDVESKPMGGTESAMISLARALGGLGHEVKIFTNVENTHYSNRVEFRHFNEAEAFFENTTVDVLIVVRQLLPGLALPARLKIFFTPDAYDQPFLNRATILNIESEKHHFEVGLYSLAAMHKFYDAIACVGHWQKNTLSQKFNVPLEKFVIIPNGIDPKLFTNRDMTAPPPSIVYASTPYRGLEHLVRLYPQIKAAVPNAGCEIFSGMQIYGCTEKEDLDGYGPIYAAAKNAGIHLNGATPRADLAKSLSACRLLAYPNTFAETFCMAVLEAQAAGLPVVTTKLAALTERIEDGVHGFLIPGLPRQPDYDRIFVQACTKLLADDELWLKMSMAARKRAFEFTYEKAASNFCNWIGENLKDTVSPPSLIFPRDEQLSVLIDGYPKKVNISANLIKNQLAQHLAALNFKKAAAAYNK